MEPADDDRLLKGTWWFPLRRYLPGWGLPVRWQGWLVLAVYILLLAAARPLFPRRAFAAYFVPYLIVLTLALLAVIWKKGEPIR